MHQQQSDPASGHQKVRGDRKSQAPRPVTPVSRSGAALGTRGRSSPKTRPARTQKPVGITKAQPPKSGGVTVGGLNISLRALVSLIIFSVIALVLVPTLLQWADQQRDFRAAVAETEAAHLQVERLQAELDNWNNPEYVAGQARSRLGYVDPGETQYSVTDAPESELAVPAQPKAAEWPPKPWNVALQEAILELDQPPAVKEAAQVATLSSQADEPEG